MVNLPFVGGLSTSRLILLATAANLGAAAVVVGVPQSFVPALSTAYAADSGSAGTEAPKLGLMLAPAGEVAGSGSEGVVVIEIDPKGLASEHGVKTGDVILDVGGTKVGAPADVRNAIMDAHKNGKR